MGQQKKELYRKKRNLQDAEVLNARRRKVDKRNIVAGDGPPEGHRVVDDSEIRICSTN